MRRILSWNCSTGLKTLLEKIRNRWFTSTDALRSFKSSPRKAARDRPLSPTPHKSRREYTVLENLKKKKNSCSILPYRRRPIKQSSWRECTIVERIYNFVNPLKKKKRKRKKNSRWNVPSHRWPVNRFSRESTGHTVAKRWNASQKPKLLSQWVVRGASPLELLSRQRYKSGAVRASRGIFPYGGESLRVSG